jgi:hypothetical protein
MPSPRFSAIDELARRKGVALGSYAWDYDTKGRLLKYTQDNGPDGSVDMTQF